MTSEARTTARPRIAPELRAAIMRVGADLLDDLAAIRDGAGDPLEQLEQMALRTLDAVARARERLGAVPGPEA